MSKPIFPNRQNIAGTASSGKAIAAFPDVCKAPAPPAPFVPVPYPHIESVEKARKEVKKVKIQSKDATTKQSAFSKSLGDNAGMSKGIASSKTQGKTYFNRSAMNVKFEGKDTSRAFHPALHNKSSVPSPGSGSAAASVTKVLDDIDEELSSYEKMLQKAPSMSYPAAKLAQSQAEQKLGNLVNQLRRATTGQPQHNQQAQQIEQFVKKALKGE